MILPFVFFITQSLDVPNHIQENKYAQHVPYESLGDRQEKNKGTMEYDPMQDLIEKQNKEVMKRLFDL